MRRYDGLKALLKHPGPVDAVLIEWRARHIADPLRRLQYLRGITERPGRRFGRPRHFAGLALLLIPFLPVRETVQAPPLMNLQSDTPAKVWVVETTADHESYSNGLRVENRHAIATRHRSYGVFARRQPDSDALEWRTDPAGIVYHATESDLAPFEPEENGRLQRIDESLLDYVRDRQSYHFVIDRFGRVHRVVPEGDVANHAGHSVWADRRWVYCNLNAAFLGIAFEARTEGQESPLTIAQMRAGRALTDMLRSRYRIPVENCVTHAQVSVNPSNMEIGYHTDWAVQFPFAAMGLSDNYRAPVSSVLLFGFTYSATFRRAVNGRMWQGLESAEEAVQGQAASRGLSSAGYALLLQKRYRTKMQALHSARVIEDNQL